SGTRLVAKEAKATLDPSALMLGGAAELFSSVPSEATLTIWVVPATRSRTKTSRTWFVSPATRLDASETNATDRPSAEMDAPKLDPFPEPPPRDTVTSEVSPVARSRTKTSRRWFLSFPTRLPAEESNATRRPRWSTVG